MPVVGEVTAVDTIDASRPVRLGFAADGSGDATEVAAAVAAVATALDTFLDGAQADAPDLLTIRGAWLTDVDPSAADILETGLADRRNPVAAARYDMEVYVEPTPTLLTSDVVVERVDGTSVAVSLVFDVSGPEPRLQLVGSVEAS